MVRSTHEFSRWKAQTPNSWPYAVLRKYNYELFRLRASHYTATKYVYRSLGKSGATLSDQPEQQFGFVEEECKRYANVSEWSGLYNQFDNFTNLNALLTSASNFETYLASVIELSLMSNPGQLLGYSQKIDGAHSIKYPDHYRANHEEAVTACTKGSWSMRIDAFERVFGTLIEFRNCHSDLEMVRKIRNEMGHAFGRDIDEARRIGSIKILPIRKLSHERLLRLQNVMAVAAGHIDKFLVEKHIGEFEMLQFFGSLRIPTELNRTERAFRFKKAVGQHGAEPRGKVFCAGLVEYWDAL